MEDKEYKIDKKEVMELGYDSILHALRKREREILNMKRAIEYERNRPPVKNWYMLKNIQFNEEFNKNRKCCDVTFNFIIIVKGLWKTIFGETRN